MSPRQCCLERRLSPQDVGIAHFRSQAPGEESQALVHGMVGVSPAMHQVFRKIVFYALADAAWW
ncbi:MAG: hypothetical protein R2864_02520 [Syntrophotaleaceae bacterium]